MYASFSPFCCLPGSAECHTCPVTTRRSVAVAGLLSATSSAVRSLAPRWPKCLYPSLYYAAPYLVCPVTRRAMRCGLQGFNLLLGKSVGNVTDFYRKRWRSGSTHHSSTARKIDCIDGRCCVKRKREKILPSTSRVASTISHIRI